MGSATTAISSSFLQESFADLEKQKALISSCTLLWKELSDHFTSLERDLQIKSDSIRSKQQTLDLSVQQTLDSLHRREQSIDSSVDLALSKVDERCEAALLALTAVGSDPPESDLVARFRSFCTKMDSTGFWDLVVSKRKEVEILRSELPIVLSDCLDPAKFAIEAISSVFPVDRRAVKVPNDPGWACVLILESLVPVLADPELGTSRPLITPTVRERAREIARTWKELVEQRGGIESAKPPDVHTFLQHLVTFGIIAKEDEEFYRRLVLSASWRRQMPKLALALGLADKMADMIDELIKKGQQLDAINFAYEAGLVYKFPPVPLLKSFLKNSKKAASSILEDRNNNKAGYFASRKEQSALRAVIKCIEDRKLEAVFPPESLQKRLEHLEKAKFEKKKPAGGPANPANKRTRANQGGGPMPPAKAGRLTNNAYVSSFPTAPTFLRSPSSHSSYPSVVPPYPCDRPSGHGLYGSRSPPAIRDPYAYPTEELAPAVHGASYPAPPMNYPAYGGYNNGLVPGYQQAYYR